MSNSLDKSPNWPGEQMKQNERDEHVSTVREVDNSNIAQQLHLVLSPIP